MKDFLPSTQHLSDNHSTLVWSKLQLPICWPKLTIVCSWVVTLSPGCSNRIFHTWFWLRASSTNVNVLTGTKVVHLLCWGDTSQAVTKKHVLNLHIYFCKTTFLSPFIRWFHFTATRTVGHQNKSPTTNKSFWYFFSLFLCICDT